MRGWAPFRGLDRWTRLAVVSLVAWFAYMGLALYVWRALFDAMFTVFPLFMVWLVVLGVCQERAYRRRARGRARVEAEALGRSVRGRR